VIVLTGAGSMLSLYFLSELTIKLSIGVGSCIAETTKRNGIDFYKYTKKLLINLPNLDIHQNTEVLDQYMPWSKMIQAACST
jgi:hypothetical protein